jgi:hypothetical protein
MQQRRADALARNESGVTLKFDWPQPLPAPASAEAPEAGGATGAVAEPRRAYVPWQPRLSGVAVSVDVSGDGADAEAVRKDPHAFLMCYGVLLHAKSNASIVDSNNGSNSSGSSSAGAWVALPGVYAPHCAPLLRGGAALDSVAVPPLQCWRPGSSFDPALQFQRRVTPPLRRPPCGFGTRARL